RIACAGAIARGTRTWDESRRPQGSRRWPLPVAAGLAGAAILGFGYWKAHEAPKAVTLPPKGGSYGVGRGSGGPVRQPRTDLSPSPEKRAPPTAPPAQPAGKQPEPVVKPPETAVKPPEPVAKPPEAPPALRPAPPPADKPEAAPSPRT